MKSSPINFVYDKQQQEALEAGASTTDPYSSLNNSYTLEA